jgi:uncharacterized protein DUF6312
MALSKRVRSVIVIGADGTARTLFRRKRKKKEQTPVLRPLETATRRVAEGLTRAAETYVEEHGDSNRKARDGWLQELGQNVFKATRKGLTRTVRGLYD